MRRFLPWLILLFPALELWVLIRVGGQIGAFNTVALLFLSIVIGIVILRLRGIHIARTMQAELAAGRLPSGQIADTFCLMVAGWLFVFPGFISDILGLLLIIPGVRQLLLSLLLSRLRAQGFQSQTVYFNSGTDGERSSAASWTCTTYGDTQPHADTERPELRGNAVVIDCKPEVVTRDEGKADDSPSGDKPN